MQKWLYIKKDVTPAANMIMTLWYFHFIYEGISFSNLGMRKDSNRIFTHGLFWKMPQKPLYWKGLTLFLFPNPTKKILKLVQFLYLPAKISKLTHFLPAERVIIFSRQNIKMKFIHASRLSKRGYYFWKKKVNLKIEFHHPCNVCLCRYSIFVGLCVRVCFLTPIRCIIHIKYM